MLDLFRSEWRRFRRVAFVVGLAHLVGLGLMSRMADATELGQQDQFAMLVVYMLLALTLAVVQVGSYRPPSRWLWLMHRPLGPSRIFTALALAAGAVIAVSILLPLLIFLAGIESLTTHVVDFRHYGTTLHAWAFAMMAWLAGAHAATSRHKAAVAVLLAPLLLVLRPASVWHLLPLVILSLAWLAFVALRGFRANRSAPIQSHAVLLVTALPLQVAFFFLTFSVTKGGIALVNVIRQGNTSRTVTSTDAIPDVEAQLRRIGLDVWEKGLVARQDSSAAQWRRDLPHARMANVMADIERFPVRNQFGTVGRPWWDGGRSVKWTFSHDQMLYHGRQPNTGASRGWWGVGGYASRERYREVPSGAMTRSSLYRIDRDTMRQRLLVELPSGEWFVGRPKPALEHLFLLTNRRLLAYRLPQDTVSGTVTLTRDWELPITDRERLPISADIAEIRDGWLVSLFYFDEWEFDGFEFLLHPWQRIFHVNGSSGATFVAQRDDIHDQQVSVGNTSSVPVASWWVSPPLYVLAHAFDVIDEGLVHPARFEPLPRVPALLSLALVTMLISAGVALLWLRGAHVTAARRRLWLFSCFWIGIPALLSLICLEPRRPPCT